MIQKHKDLIELKEKFKGTSYCSAAFTEIYAGSNGKYRLCCHAKANNNLAKYTSDTTLPFEYFLSKEMEKIRDDMLEGKQISDCIKCHELEKHDGVSYRHKYIFRDGYLTDVQERSINLKLRISGSFCNLACYMCHPVNSTTKRNELKEIYDFADASNIFNSKESPAIAVKHDQWHSIMNNILDNIHLVKIIHMTGGETLQLPKYWEFLEKIPDEHAKHLELAHDTNLTKLKYKNHHVLDNAKRFKSFHLSVSCDHISDKLSWIRYPINVQEFENNLSEIKQSNDITSKINCTVSILNIDDLFEIRDYYQNKFNIEFSADCLVIKPIELSIANLPQKLKDEYIEKYKDDFPLIIAELNKPSNKSLFNKGLEYCDRLSAHRNFDFRILWKDWLKKVKDYS